LNFKKHQDFTNELKTPLQLLLPTADRIVSCQ